MKHLFSSRLPKRGYRVVLVTALFAAMLAFGAFSFTPATHAASVIPQAPQRENNCIKFWPCVTIWATQVNVRNYVPDNCSKFPHKYPDKDCPPVGTLAGGGERVLANCQQPGQTIYYGGYTSNWWTQLWADNGGVGYTSNVFIVGGVKISGVPDCPLGL